MSFFFLSTHQSICLFSCVAIESPLLMPLSVVISSVFMFFQSTLCIPSFLFVLFIYLPLHSTISALIMLMFVTPLFPVIFSGSNFSSFSSHGLPSCSLLNQSPAFHNPQFVRTSVLTVHRSFKHLHLQFFLDLDV